MYSYSKGNTTYYTEVLEPASPRYSNYMLMLKDMSIYKEIKVLNNGIYLRFLWMCGNGD